jgi:hypothetical protein
MPGTINLSKSARIASNDSAADGGQAGSDRRISPGVARDNTG